MNITFLGGLKQVSSCTVAILSKIAIECSAMGETPTGPSADAHEEIPDRGSGHDVRMHTPIQSDPESQETRLYETAEAAILHALLSARGSAIVNIGNLDPKKIIPHFRQKVVVVTAQEILKEKENIQVERGTLMILTGYSSQFADNFEQENLLQGYVRHHANQYGCCVLVLSAGMPSPHVFTMDHWWYNGPVPSHNCFSIAQDEPDKLTLKEFGTTSKGFREPLEWKPNDRKPVEYKLK